MHGFGSNEGDLHSFANYLPEKYTVISIRAPYTLPTGGYAWYNINFDNDMNKFNDHNQAKNSIQINSKFLDEVFNKFLLTLMTSHFWVLVKALFLVMLLG